MSKKETDVCVIGAALYFLPIQTRVPLKFGPETTTEVTCARVKLSVRDRSGHTGEGWGETPLSVHWVWPSRIPYQERNSCLKTFCVQLSNGWTSFEQFGHPVELGSDFQEAVLPLLLRDFNNQRSGESMPWLAALVCCSAYDIALHDAYGQLHRRRAYETYNPEFMTRDLASFLTPDPKSTSDFQGAFPADFLFATPPRQIRAWHLIGGLDALGPEDLTGNEPNDGYPVLLTDWIRRDGLKCLKIKLRGDDPNWDYQRMLRVGQIAIAEDVDWLSADFNCTVQEVSYVTEILDRLRDDQPRIYGMILYVEQPFPYDLERFGIDVRAVSARKPLFLDESAHDWKLVRLGQTLGWSGVALKTCKTQTGALLSCCWAKVHGMTLMVQDLSNPMLAQIPHVLLAAHVGTIMGVETNGMQFYPEASKPEQQIHPGLYHRSAGLLDLTTIHGPGFGYRLSEIDRELPVPAAINGSA